MLRRSLVAGSLLLSLLVLQMPGAAFAQDSQRFSGIPTLDDSGNLYVGTRQVELWGVESLAADQECWKGQTAWNCGEQAMEALKHIVADRPVSCVSKSKNNELSLKSLCTTEQNGDSKDIALLWISHGWAFADKKEGNESYLRAESNAREARHGVWTSRFQTSADWKSGNQKFVSYEMQPKPEISPNDDSELIVGPSEYVIEENDPTTAK